MTSALPILDYWRNSLADTALLSMSGKDLNEQGRAVPIFHSVFRQGQLSLEFIQKNLKDGLKDLKHGALIAPITLVPVSDHGVARKSGTVIPLWIPVSVGRDGRMLPLAGASPWIPRDLLEPIVRSHELPILGDQADADAYLTQNPLPNAGWGELWAWSQGLFQAVTGQPMDGFELEGYAIQAFPNRADPKAFLLALEGPRSGPEGILIRCYDTLAGSNTVPALLEDVVGLGRRERRALLCDDAFLEATTAHLGQMSDGFPLSRSQRESLVHFFTLEEGKALAVNGPPGTGKTTLLQSVIATIVVRAAVAGGDPPLIMAASTNNQAVTNVIDSFKTSTTDPFASRWLPGVDSYGLYWPSGQKEQEAQERGYQFVAYGEQGDFPARVSSRNYFDQARTTFLDAFESNLRQRPAGLKEAVADLHQRIATLATRLQKLPGAYLVARQANALDLTPQLTAAQRGVEEAEAGLAASQQRFQAWVDFLGKTPWWMGLLSFLPSVRAQQDTRARGFASLHGLDCPAGACLQDVETILRSHLDGWRSEHQRRVTTLREVTAQEQQRVAELNAYQTLRRDLCLPEGLIPPEQDLLDTSVRYRLFHLACHYWEARWLLGREQDFDPASSSAEPQRNTPEGKLAYLRRLSMLAPCSIATLYRVPYVLSCSRPFRPMWGALDLLIIDEAGQVSPEVGGAAFAFAKNALVVGDTLQIEPVRSIPGRVDQGNITKAGFDTGSFPAAFQSSQGTLMAVAQLASPFWKHTERGGMFLCEHRRCVRSLISFCNDLAYGGALEPKREDPKEPGPFPIWGYAHVPGWTEKKHGRSLGNPMEAAAIAQWIQDHRVELEGLHKSGDLRDAVAVVAPFSYQVELVLKELQARNLPEITVGTVHALQGAERPLVIFSPTCTRSSPRPFFFDQGPSMLNVAVSRAKDSFLVFGDMEIFEEKPGSKRPSALLARHLFRNPDHALEGYGLPEPKNGSKDFLAQAERIASLEGHRQALSDSFEQAAKRLIIVSPWITADALTADELPAKISKAVEKGIVVQVYTDPALNKEPGHPSQQQLRPTAGEAADLLKCAGADIRWTRNIHNKNLLVDDHTVVLGSFNWLSARRNEADKYHRFDSSIRLRGPQVKEWIDRFEQEMEARVVTGP